MTGVLLGIEGGITIIRLLPLERLMTDIVDLLVLLDLALLVLC